MTVIAASLKIDVADWVTVSTSPIKNSVSQKAKNAEWKEITTVSGDD